MRIIFFILLFCSSVYAGDVVVNSPKVNTTVTNTGNIFTGINFCNTVWSGTQITNSPAGTSDLGCSYLTGKGITYAEYSKLVSSYGITKAEQNLGFTQMASANIDLYWSWPQSVTFSQSLMNVDTGEAITQNRTFSKGYGISQFLGKQSLDNIVIGTNTASNYLSTMRFDFTSGSNYFSGADISNPYLSITYNKIDVTQPTINTTSINTVTTDASGKLITTKSLTGNTLNLIKTSYADNTTSSSTTSATSSSPTNILNTTSGVSSGTTSDKTSLTNTTTTSTTTNTTSVPVETTTSSTKTETPTSTTVEQKTENKTEESKTDLKSETKTETTSNKQDNKSQVASTNVSSNKDNKQIINNIQVKDINSLKIETQQTLSNMIDNKMIDVYSVPFYKSAKIYENQIQLIDNRIIYPGVSLRAYLAKDLLAKKSIQLAEIREEKKQLLIDLEVLKDVK
jgi:hypothetical protein